MPPPTIGSLLDPSLQSFTLLHGPIIISHPLSSMSTVMLHPLPWAFGTHCLDWGSKCQLITSLLNKRNPSSISSASVSVQPSLMQHLVSSQTTSILASSSTHSQHYLHSTGCWFWLLTLSSVKALTYECSMCLESTLRLLMHCLTFRMTSLLLCSLSLSSQSFNPLELCWGQPGYEPLAILSGQATS